MPDLHHMRRAIELAAQGQGFVEPNPMVGCVVARGDEIVGEGWHRRFGGDHAEVEALRMAGACVPLLGTSSAQPGRATRHCLCQAVAHTENNCNRAAGATLYVTLEPCCHHGKTPPCAPLVAASGVRRVVVAMRDPFPQVQGGGIAQLQAAGIEVEVGLLEAEARRLNSPYLKLVEKGKPWIIAKWAMTLDGKIATCTGDSKWISNAQSREVVHTLRSRVDAIIVGRGTAERDDPLLTARARQEDRHSCLSKDQEDRHSCLSKNQEDRHSCLSKDQEDRHSCLSKNQEDRHSCLSRSNGPRLQEGQTGMSALLPMPFPCPRTALRVVLDTRATLADGSRLVRTARETPVLVAVGEESEEADRLRLRHAGCEVFVCEGATHAERLDSLIAELGSRRFTNVLVEGGGHLLGSLLDARAIDEVHVFIGPKLFGGERAATPMAGHGVADVSAALCLESPEVRRLGDDLYITGRCLAGSSPGNREGRESYSTDR